MNKTLLSREIVVRQALHMSQEVGSDHRNKDIIPTARSSFLTTVIELCITTLIVLLSRIVQMIFCLAMDAALPDHIPTGAQGFNCLSANTSNNYICDALSPFTHWDSAHFLKISRVGYANEQSLVFFPLFPGMLHLLGTTLHGFVNSDEVLISAGADVDISLETCLVVAGLLINLCCSVLSAHLLIMYCRRAFTCSISQLKTVLLLFRHCVLSSGLLRVSVFALSAWRPGFAGVWTTLADMHLFSFGVGDAGKWYFQHGACCVVAPAEVCCAM